MRCFLVLWFLAGLVYAEDPIHFADDKLKVAIEDELWVIDPTPTDMLDLIELMSSESFNTQSSGIQDIRGIEYATNLQRLQLRLHLIGDIRPLAGLTSLYSLDLSQNQIHDISPLSQMTVLEDLNLHANKISDVSPLGNLSNVYWLDLHYNLLEDLSPLSNLTELTFLSLYLNEITDLTPLLSLAKLEELNLGYNRLSDLSLLKDLPNLRALNVESNSISDISPLADCPSLGDLRLNDNMITDIDGLMDMRQLVRLDLSGNPLNDEAYHSQLSAIAQANPGISLNYDPRTGPPSHVSATKGLYENRVHISWHYVWNGPSHTSHYRISRSTSDEETKVPISPWQQDTTYDDTTAEPGLQYRYWVQTAASPDGTSAGGYSIPDTGWLLGTLVAPLHSTLYVDSNTMADSNHTGNIEYPFSCIQEAINMAIEGDCIMVRPGIYFETIDFLGKNLTLTGMEPGEPNKASFPVLKGNDQEVVVQFTQGEDPNCTLEGFIITRGNGAILCDRSSPTITHCIIAGNRSTDPDHAVITCLNSQAWFQHCTITDNMGSALFLNNSDVSLTNCIVWGNQPEEIFLRGTSAPWIMYSNIASPWDGLGNMTTDPLFARPGHWVSGPNGLWIEGDYHLQSEGGRWDAESTLWLKDLVMSHCIDAADPITPYIRETEPHGNRANMGAYGNTPQASRTYVERTASGLR